MTHLTRAGVTPYRYANMASIHRDRDKPNWFCQFYDPEGYRRNRTTGTENPKIARTICVNIERAATLARHNRLSNEKGLKLIRETCAAIADTHGKLAADQAHKILKDNIEEFVKIAGGELTSYTVRGWLQSWLDSRTDASKATMIEYRHEVNGLISWGNGQTSRSLPCSQSKSRT